MISVQTQDFCQNSEYKNLKRAGESGAIVTFVGSVRDFSATKGNSTDSRFLLEHYPGMTESVLEKIEQQASQRWDLLETRIIHRVGNLYIDDQIVFVGVSSRHREDAFAACHYMIDILKTQAPFWKKEGGDWVSAKESDQDRAARWLKD